VNLVLGPLLRWVGETEATIWVETDAPGTVEVLGAQARTFAVAGHHYALVQCRGLAPGHVTPYEVRLDGRLAWPPPGAERPPSVVRTLRGDGRVRIVFGSCRLSEGQDARSVRRFGADALRAYAQRLAGGDEAGWPDALLLLGDQVYADEVSPRTRAFIRARRDVRREPKEGVADFEEYAQLYREAWSEPWLRWLLSTVPSAMIFDDHDMHDDWNTSAAWVAHMRAQDWWADRIRGGYMAYWLYQHLGNLAPEDLAEDATWAAVQNCGGDATAVLEALAAAAENEVRGTRWSFARALGPARLVMVDSRAGRVLEPGARSMLDEQEWGWLEEQARGDVDHLLLGTSLPWLLAPGMHHLEAWSEAVCDGAWGGGAAAAGETLRQALDLEHWAAFSESFARLAELVAAVGAGERGRAPASIVALSGDVHHAYLAEVAFPRGARVRSAVWQAVCSPFRNPLGPERHVLRAGWSRAATVAGRWLARAAGVGDPPVRWRLAHDAPWFDNQVATLTLEGRRARLELERTRPGHDELARVFAADLA